MIGLYRRLLKNVRSVNGLNRVQIAIENALTPSLAWSLSPEVAPSPAIRFLSMIGPAPASQTGMTVGEALFIAAEEWRERLMRQMALAGKSAPEPFVPVRLQRDVLLFSNPEARGRKRLLVVFAGGAKRPMMPVHVFLQHLSAATTDVLFLRDPSRDAFRGGLFGIGTTIEEVIDSLPDLLDLKRYEAVSTLGTSAGGVAALLAGFTLGARGILSVGGHHPERWDFRGEPLVKCLPDLRHGPGRHSRVLLMWGAQSSEDQLAAETTAALVGATLMAVSDKNGPVRHGALFPLAQQRRFAHVLEAVLSADTDTLPLEVPSLSISDARMERRA